MTELNVSISQPTTVVAAISAAIVVGQLQYPPRVEPYELKQVRGTHSDFLGSLSRSVSVDHFAQQIAAIYNSFAVRQERLGADFEAMIFSDLESLYEA